MKDFFLEKISRRNLLKNTAKLCFKVGLSSIFFDWFKTEAFGNVITTALNTGSGFEPAYLKLHKTGELKKRAEKLWAIMERCRLCPRRCGANRLEGKRGFCRAPGATPTTP